LSQEIRITSDKRTEIEAKTIQAGFLDQGFINTMRFSELNGPEEYDNTHLYVDWHACFEYGLQQLMDWLEWIKRQEDIKEIWDAVPEEQKKRIQRTKKDIEKYRFDKPSDDKENIRTIRNHLQKYNWNLIVGVYDYDGHTGILNGRMARAKGHKNDLLKVVEGQRNREKEISMGEQKRGFHIPGLG